ncbi:hypothetical protein [Enterococcus gallinarum]|uniref:hypothetical protein n=1 Tax=Enterococcus gallinarum TaxID=1353 RepID=UPI002DBD5266|nr:hypothetical protein [Enterococcus gallinarum]MEB5968959.1 hypothetical protein [Enterococcus gallinarum]
MKNIEKYYNELYSEKVTLQNLVQNIFVDSYQSINLKKDNGLIICEAICKISEIDTITYRYSFSDEKLLLLEKINVHKTTILYDREQEIKKLNSKIITIKNKFA